MLRGIDVSYAQKRIDWGAVKETGLVDFVFAKATEGLHTDDPQYARNKKVCNLRDIPLGAYHFFHPSEDPIAQAEHFLRVAGPDEVPVKPMVDVEVTDGCTPAAIELALGKFDEYIEKRLGVRCEIIYTYLGFWRDRMHGSSAFAGHKLFIAEYNRDPAPTLPGGWSDWTLWQWSDKGAIMGIPTGVDLDRLNGDDLSVICF